MIKYFFLFLFSLGAFAQSPVSPLSDPNDPKFLANKKYLLEQAGERIAKQEKIKVCATEAKDFSGVESCLGINNGTADSPQRAAVFPSYQKNIVANAEKNLSRDKKYRDCVTAASNAITNLKCTTELARGMR